jgi:hypothetical protein
MDILSAGKQFIGFGIHPDTGAQYVWPLEGPLDVRAEELPAISDGQVDTLLLDAGFRSRTQPKKEGAARQNASGNDREYAFSADGRTADGREALLRDLILELFRHHIAVTGALPDENYLAASAYSRFLDEADNSDAKWRFEHALTKARTTIRRWHDGQLKPGRGTPISGVSPYFLRSSVTADEASAGLGEMISEFVTKALSLNSDDHGVQRGARAPAGLGKTDAVIRVLAGAVDGPR